LRWINHLVSLGRMGTTIDRVEDAASAAMATRLAVPYLGAHCWHDDADVPSGAIAVRAGAVGYVQFMDMPALSRLCEEAECEAWLPIHPGAFVFEDTVLAWVHGQQAVPEDLAEQVVDQFVITTARNFDQDPRFGLAVMAEIGSRAL